MPSNHCGTSESPLASIYLRMPITNHTLLTISVRCMARKRRWSKAAWRWKSAVMQLRWYLKAFARSDTEHRPNVVVKIEELPQHENHTVLLYTSPTGYFNLAAHYALDGADRKITKPDLGTFPTFSSYTHPLNDNAQRPKTPPLHLQHIPPLHDLRVSMTGTQYILVSRDQTRQNVASWTIFRREDTAQLREFLAQEHPRCGYDIINERNHFLDQEDLRKLRERKVVPYTAVQKPGVAVIIPPGCVYQAKTIGNIIQVTNSLIDHNTIRVILELRDEWRKHRLPDTVQIKWILWHAWHSLLALKEAREKAPPTPNPDLTSFKSVSDNACASKRQKTRIFHCPHAGCKGNRRLFGVPNLDHWERALLTEKAPEEWDAEFEGMLMVTSASWDEPGDPIVISSSP
ncbi:hypothetical protein BC629DRAFT_1575657 [Irpex lacteus]|nr:hypothetical protein BC629DRAFT_1575657 [Irpex lacteus]